VGYVAIVVAMLFTGLSRALEHASLDAWIVAIVITVAVTFLTLWVYTRLSRCPRCAARFGPVARAAVKGRAANCSNCGVSVDEPMPGP
jgi:predicted permease